MLYRAAAIAAVPSVAERNAGDRRPAYSAGLGQGLEAGRIYCPPVEQGDVKAALAISFSMWQCDAHGDAAGPGFVH